ncbi:MAG: hypothetical protein K0S07_935 [Chlamydiales bacterium]|jgi:hypothetical protein|nr:hypothetical protein [Chlamydiales bacterium]
MNRTGDSPNPPDSLFPNPHFTADPSEATRGSAPAQSEEPPPESYKLIKDEDHSFNLLLKEIAFAKGEDPVAALSNPALAKKLMSYVRPGSLKMQFDRKEDADSGEWSVVMKRQGLTVNNTHCYACNANLDAMVDLPDGRSFTVRFSHTLYAQVPNTPGNSQQDLDHQALFLLKTYRKQLFSDFKGDGPANIPKERIEKITNQQAVSILLHRHLDEFNREHLIGHLKLDWKDGQDPLQGGYGMKKKEIEIQTYTKNGSTGSVAHKQRTVFIKEDSAHWKRKETDLKIAQKGPGEITDWWRTRYYDKIIFEEDENPESHPGAPIIGLDPPTAPPEDPGRKPDREDKDSGDGSSLINRTRARRQAPSSPKDSNAADAASSSTKGPKEMPAAASAGKASLQEHSFQTINAAPAEAKPLDAEDKENQEQLQKLIDASMLVADAFKEFAKDFSPLKVVPQFPAIADRVSASDHESTIALRRKLQRVSIKAFESLGNLIVDTKTQDQSSAKLPPSEGAADIQAKAKKPPRPGIPAA